MVNDPISDLLTRIRNAGMAKHSSVTMPSSTQKLEVARVLKDEGYIGDFSSSEDGVFRNLTVQLKYHRDAHVITGIKRQSTPGQRIYVRSSALPKVLDGLGVAIITTSQGVMTGKQAAEMGIGGEYICSVW